MTDSILVVESSPEGVAAIERAISRSHPRIRLEFLGSGDEVLPRLTAHGAALPGIMLLCLTVPGGGTMPGEGAMPGEGGLAVIRQVRADATLNAIRIVVFTSSEDQAEADACYAAGADSYIYKPVSFALFQTVLRQTLDYWGNVAAPPPTQT